MAYIYLACTLLILGIYLYKVLLHYKLLRIERDGGLNENEDYFLTWLMSTEDFIIKARSSSVMPVKEYYDHPESIKLKKQINSLLPKLNWIIIGTSLVALIDILIDQI